MNSTPRGATLLSLSLAFCVPAFAQTCPGADNTFWKRDSLAQNPSGLTAVGVVPGLCEGEAAAVVFEMPANMAPQRLTQVVAPWGHAPAGTNGFQAALDVEIYDGVSFSGGTPVMGSPVFTLSGTGQSLQVQSHALILPNDPTLLSLELYQQALSFDAINPFGAVLSDAAKLVIGI